METEYIEKQAAIWLPVLPKEHREYQTFNLDDAYESGWADALGCVERIPPADVRPVKRGRWIVRETAYGDTDARCSECGFTTLINEPGNGLHMLSDLNYCPVCGSYNGADMRGDEDG